MQQTRMTFLTLLQETFPASCGEDTLLKSNPLRLGGDSIIVAGLAAKIWRLWSVSIPVSTLLHCHCFADILEQLPETVCQVKTNAMAVSQGELFPQSVAQQMIYGILRRQPDNTAYNIPLIAALPQAITPGRFAEAVRETAALFPALFCHFDDSQGEYYFRYTGVSAISVMRFDTLQQARERFVQPFDLNDGALIRAAIVPFDGQQTHLMLDFCHIVADGLSIKYFLQQLRQVLVQTGAESKVELRSLFDYCRWIRTEQYGAEMAAARLFWRQRLPVGLAKPHWPVPPMNRLTVLDYAVQQQMLTPELSQAIRQRAELLDVTPFIVCLLAWALLQSDITAEWQGRLGVVTSGRHEAAWQETFGMFVNTLLIPAAFEPQMSVQRAASYLSAQMSETMEWQHFPFAAQLDLIQERQADTAPLDALFAFQNTHYQNIDVAGGKFRAFCEAKKMAQFGMVIQLFDLGMQGYEIQWEHAPSRFSSALVYSLLQRYCDILQQLTCQPIDSPLEKCIASEQTATPEQTAITAVEFNFF